jgi:hypothetical protein
MTVVDLAYGNVDLVREDDVEVVFVVAKVEIDFTSIIKDKDFVVPVTYQPCPVYINQRDLLGGSHSAGIDSHLVRVPGGGDCQ